MRCGSYRSQFSAQLLNGQIVNIGGWDIITWPCTISFLLVFYQITQLLCQARLGTLE